MLATEIHCEEKKWNNENGKEHDVAQKVLHLIWKAWKKKKSSIICWEINYWNSSLPAALHTAFPLAEFLCWALQSAMGQSSASSRCSCAVTQLRWGGSAALGTLRGGQVTTEIAQQQQHASRNHRHLAGCSGTSRGLETAPQWPCFKLRQRSTKNLSISELHVSRKHFVRTVNMYFLSHASECAGWFPGGQSILPTTEGHSACATKGSSITEVQPAVPSCSIVDFCGHCPKYKQLWSITVTLTGYLHLSTWLTCSFMGISLPLVRHPGPTLAHSCGRRNLGLKTTSPHQTYFPDKYRVVRRKAAKIFR